MGTKNQNGNSKKPVKRVVRTGGVSQPQDKYLTSSKSSRSSTKKRTASSSSAQKRSASASRKRRTSGKRGAGRTIAASIGKVFLTLFLVIVITGCVVVTTMSVFVMKYVDSSDGIDLDHLETSYTSKIYGLDAEGNDTVVQTMAASGRRSWVSIDQVPDYVQKAVICTEDKRFLEHEGVDWVRTFAAFANMGVEMVTGKSYFESGASTITQQLIKNINGDFYNRTPATKMKEILGALNLERRYTKSKILEAYINYMSVGYNNYGLQAGAEYYFNKSVDQLTLAEAAALTSTTKSPNGLNPIDNPEGNKERRNWVLDTMLEEGYITQEEHDTAVAEELTIVPFQQSDDTQNKGIYNWYVDAVIQEVKGDLMEEYGYDEETALTKINSAGLQIYTPMDIAMQEKLEQIFLDDSYFGAPATDHLNASMIIMDYDGNIKALCSSRTQKEVNLGWNNAVDMYRSMGSCMKPLVAYAPALQSDLIYWSKMDVDEPKVDWGNGKLGPNNWNDSFSGPITIIDALKYSKNTIPVGLEKQLGLDNCVKFLQDNLNMTVDASKVGYTLTLGQPDMSFRETTAAYQIFGNGGYYSPSKLYTQVVDASGKVILEADTSKKQVLNTDTAFIMNRMLRQVIVGSGATGTAANLGSMEVVGKTGTNEDTDLSFVGCTPYYVSSLWIGYDDAARPLKNYGYSPTKTWKNIMTSIYEGYEPKSFELDSTGVTKQTYCRDTGLLAGSGCTNVDTGYYKQSNLPPVCAGNHVAPETEETTDQGAAAEQPAA
ncbi:MAG: transglycosylase domain-containing protein [Massiliimalia sp.]|jgi:penicillin-binding protein 1A